MSSDILGALGPGLLTFRKEKWETVYLRAPALGLCGFWGFGQHRGSEVWGLRLGLGVKGLGSSLGFRV